MLIMLMCSIISRTLSSPSHSCWVSVHSQQRLSFPPTLSSVWNLCFCRSIFTLVYYIFSTTRSCFLFFFFLHADRYCIPLYPYVSLRLICTLQHFTGLGLIPSLDSGDVHLLYCFLIKRVAGKCNPWLHFTPQ